MFDKKFNLIPLLGLLIWLIIIAQKFPFQFKELNYVVLLFLAAPLWLVPLSLAIFKQKNALLFSLSLAILLAISFQFDKGFLAACCAIPWLFFCSLLAITNASKWFEKKNEISDHVILAGFLYLPIGGAWAVADRLGFRPLDFDPTIVLLTAVHFHYAGYILPLIAGLVLKHFHFEWKKYIGYGIIVGIPLVAIGITSTKLEWPEWIELATVIIMTFSAASVAMLHITLGFKYSNMLYGILWIIAGIALFNGMVLAFLYGIRTIYPLSFLTIPWMYAVHGTLNAVGFAAPALLGWYLKGKAEK